MQAAKLLGASGTAAKTYVDDVFSAYTYTGNGSTQTITNGIDLAGKGGMVWIKERSSTGFSHRLWYTASGTSSTLHTHDVGGLGAEGGFTSFNSNGFTLNTTASNYTNYSGATFVGWTFRNADKFYNHTTVVKTGGSNATVSFANLTTLGMVRVKRTDSNGSWYIWHRSLTAGKLLIGETTAAEATLGHITVSGTTVTLVNGTIADGTYLVEGFAHDTGTDGLIQCGSFTTDGSGGGSVTLGWEPQFMMMKNTGGVGVPAWAMYDTTRSLNASTATNTPALLAYSSAAEASPSGVINPTATGFVVAGLSASATIVYLAIRRPNKPPTTGTQVYSGITSSAATGTAQSTGFPVDIQILTPRGGGTGSVWHDRLRGVSTTATASSVPFMNSSATTAEANSAANTHLWNNDGFAIAANWSGVSTMYHNLKRAPGVMDVVCYTGTGSATTVAHGLGAVPELMISKTRGTANPWQVWCKYRSFLSGTAPSDYCTAVLNNANAFNGYTESSSINALPTASVFSLGTQAVWNGSTNTAVMYLFATLAGISKVGSYTGTATTNAINCGFTTGARFVMIKRADSTGDWYVWDTTRGIIAGNDPYLLLNSTAAEVTGTDYIDPSTSGFELSSTAPAAINASGGTFIYLAFA